MLESLEFGRMFNERLEAASWPPKIKTVSLRSVQQHEGRVKGASP